MSLIELPGVVWAAVQSSGCTSLFNTRCFVLAFLPATLLGFWAIRSQRWRRDWLLFASLVFYSLWDPRFTILLLLVASANYVGARLIETRPNQRRALVMYMVALDLAVLAFFKYAMFVAGNIQDILGLANIPHAFALPAMILPVGISFYTFQAISYVVDVSRGHVTASRSFVGFLTYLTLFPQLIAGPIVRYAEVQPQLADLTRPFDATQFSRGMQLFAFGLFKKVVIADEIGSRIDPLWADPGSMDFYTANIASIGFAVQTYLDFSAYSDMAIGLGGMIGLVFPENFRSPYSSPNPRDYWRRWHMTFSSFMRDYVYIPLGGNHGSPLRRNLVIMAVFGLGGLWHGASWTFVLWGLYSGACVVAYMVGHAKWDLMPIWLQIILYFWIRLPGAAFFRAPDVATSFHVISLMYSIPATIPSVAVAILLAAMLAVVLWLCFVRLPALTMLNVRAREGAVTAAVLVTSVLMMNIHEEAFIYYQF